MSGFRNQMAVFILVLSALNLIPATVGQCDDPVFSGPQAGEPLRGFELQGVYDDLADKTFDPIALAGGKPTLVVFVHKLTRPGMALTRALTSYAHSLVDPAPAAVVVWLDDDQAKAKEYLNRARKSLQFQVPVGVSVDGGEGPGAYGLNRNVELTILIADENKVVANAALVQPSLTDGPKIAAELSKRLKQEPPTVETLEKFAYPGRQDSAMKRRARSAAPTAPKPEAER
ncbi:hypothetical protein NHH03_23840 [Stieleria sp. TO1_6]|uniref:hypothetical protein n=1 Tax=Stieleria tagensis TaxID=2956795 RepID=UPI00209A9B2C|nr:hypothetical protein [Stieleria tagensis]MCO8124790.1 hypothetical protein [Stieleria tagensis]